MNRRGFLRRMSGALLGTVAVFYCPGILEDVIPEHIPGLRLSWKAYEEVGIVVVNDMAIKKISVRN